MTSDQATSLRALAAKGQGNNSDKTTVVKTSVVDNKKIKTLKNVPPKSRARVITITSGKGGVGKTNCSAALAYYLFQKKRKVLLMDFDFGMGNTDLLLGNKEKTNITKLLKGDKDISEAIVKSRYGFEFIKGVRDVRFADLPHHIINRLISGLQKVESSYDDIIIDTGAGAHHVVIQSVMKSDVKLFIIKPEKSSWEDAYQIIKHLRQKGYSKGFQILINMAKNKHIADLTAKNFMLTCEKSLKIQVDYKGYLLQDDKVSDSNQCGEVFLAKYPNSSVSLLFQNAFDGFEKPKKDLRIKNIGYLEALFTGLN
ncbi:MAG: hypothetical protein COA79_07565 [Planctomycetota bacterium]|nr:MAG: hypothetical protein COA79_07565 [Planctomycetota bacterium]